MGLIGTLFTGFFVGLFARFLKPGRDEMGIIMTSLLGIAGAFFGAYLGQAVGIYQVGEPAGFVGSLVGAIIILFIFSMFAKKD